MLISQRKPTMLFFETYLLKHICSMCIFLHSLFIHTKVKFTSLISGLLQQLHNLLESSMQLPLEQNCSSFIIPSAELSNIKQVHL